MSDYDRHLSIHNFTILDLRSSLSCPKTPRLQNIFVRIFFSGFWYKNWYKPVKQITRHRLKRKNNVMQINNTLHSRNLKTKLAISFRLEPRFDFLMYLFLWRLVKIDVWRMNSCFYNIIIEPGGEEEYGFLSKFFYEDTGLFVCFKKALGTLLGTKVIVSVCDVCVWIRNRQYY